jgi:hypothetical protein
MPVGAALTWDGIDRYATSSYRGGLHPELDEHPVKGQAPPDLLTISTAPATDAVNSEVRRSISLYGR